MQLFKKDSKGKMRTLIITVNDNRELVSESGLLNGKLTKNTRQVTAKNIGRANETTQEEQCLVEHRNLVLKKLKDGYHETQEEAEAEQIVKPMLATSYDPETIKLKFPVYTQPKLDGMRAIWIYPNLVSRTNRIITTVPHITEELIKNYIHTPLDGELYIHGENFQDNMKAIKKANKNTPRVKFHVYDTVEPKEGFYSRIMNASVQAMGLKNTVLVETNKAFAKDEVDLFYEDAINKGYEGLMIRADDPYEMKRSKTLLKFKKFIDIAVEIIDVVPNDKIPEQGTFLVHDKEHDTTFKTGMKFSHQERKDFLRSKEEHIGKTAEVRFFEYSTNNVPRFPVCVGIRLDK